MAKYSDSMGGLGYTRPRQFIAFGPHKVVSEAILGHLKQFLSAVHRSVYCNCACVLQLR